MFWGPRVHWTPSPSGGVRHCYKVRSCALRKQEWQQLAVRMPRPLEGYPATATPASHALLPRVCDQHHAQKLSPSCLYYVTKRVARVPPTATEIVGTNISKDSQKCKEQRQARQTSEVGHTCCALCGQHIACNAGERIAPCVCSTQVMDQTPRQTIWLHMAVLQGCWRKQEPSCAALAATCHLPLPPPPLPPAAVGAYRASQCRADLLNIDISTGASWSAERPLSLTLQSSLFAPQHTSAGGPHSCHAS